MQISILLALLVLGSRSFIPALALPFTGPESTISSISTSTPSPTKTEPTIQPSSPSRFHAAPENIPSTAELLTFDPTLPVIQHESPSPPPSSSSNTQLEWKPYTAPPALSNQPQLPMKQTLSENSPEVFPLGCSTSAYDGGKMALHWVQSDGSCKSRLEVRVRALFRWESGEGGSGKRVLVGEEAF